jgi:plastocyanin
VSARRKSLLTFLVVPLVLVLSLVGIGVANAAHSGSSTKVRHDNIATPTITISSFVYHTPASVKRGVLVNVVNKDAVKHTVTNPGGRFNITVPAHSTRSFRAPRVVGSFKINCSFHPTMHGLLKVVA